MRALAPVGYEQATPDQASLGSPGSEEASNVFPALRGYKKRQAFTPSTSALDNRARGAISARSDADETVVASYAGDEGIEATPGSAKLYRSATTSWSDASKLGGYEPTARWEFAQFDNEVYAVNGFDQTQFITIGGATFADIPSPADIVRAKHIAVVRNFLVLGNLEDDDGVQSNRIRWSPFNNPLGDWSISKVTQADFQRLRGNSGAIQRIIGGTEGLIFLEDGVWRISYVGSPFVFRLDFVEESIGTLSGGSCVRYGSKVYFLTRDGFRAQPVGGTAAPIGEERIDRTVLADLDSSYLESIQVGVSDKLQLIIWAYPGAGSLGGVANKLAVYNLASDRWATGDEAIEVFFNLLTSSRSIDDFDDDVGGGGTQSPPLYDSIDDIPGSLDDRVWGGGLASLGAFNGSHEAGTFSGPTRTAIVTSAETQHTPGRRTFVNYVRPIVDGGQVTVSVGARNSQTEPVVFGAEIPQNADGVCPVRVDARYHSYRTTITGDFEDALGIQPYGEPAGAR